MKVTEAFADWQPLNESEDRPPMRFFTRDELDELARTSRARVGLSQTQEARHKRVVRARAKK